MYSVFGRHYAPVVAAQIVVSVATVVLVYWLASLLLPRPFALVAACVLAIDPASVIFANQLLTETLFTFVLTLGLAVIVIAQRRGPLALAALAGVLFGIAVLIRPVAEYLPIALAPALVLTSPRRLRGGAVAAILVVGFLVPTGLWAIRNYEKTGVPIISTIDGHNMLQYLAVGALVESGERRQLAQHYVLVRLAPHVRPGDNAARVSRAEVRVGLAIVAEHPVGAFKDWLKGEVKLLFGPARSETATLLTGRDVARGLWLRSLILVEELVTLVILLGATAGLALSLLRRIRIPELWILISAAVYLVVVSGGHEAYSRFRVPVAPVLAVLVASTCAYLRRSRSGPAVSDS